MAPHSGTLAWKIPWTEEPGGLQSMGSLRIRHDWATSLSLFTFMHWRRKWQPTPVFLPGESQGRGSLVGCRLWGRTESDTTAAPFIYVYVINTFTIPLYRGKSGIQTLSSLLTGTQDLGGRGWVTPRSSSCRFSSLSHYYTMRKLDKSTQLFPRSLFRRGSYST